MYKMFYDSNGRVDAINRESDGASLPYNSQSKTFDETHPLVLELRQWEQNSGTPLDLSDRTPPIPDIIFTKLGKQMQLSEIASVKHESLTAGYSNTERDTWESKEREATLLFETNNVGDAKYLAIQAIATTGATSESDILSATKQLGAIVLAKADQLRTISALISGARARKWAEVEALTELEEILSYPVAEGWPF